MAADCRATGAEVRRYAANVAVESDVEAFMDAVAADCGALDVLINNAGITRDGLLMKYKDGELLGKMSLENWQAVLDVNLTGTFLCAREAAVQMARFGAGGVIINISSLSRVGNFGQSNYSATKARRRGTDRPLGARAGAPRHPHRRDSARPDQHREGGGDEARGTRPPGGHGAGEATRRPGRSRPDRTVHPGERLHFRDA